MEYLASPISLVVFDWDDTLVASEAAKTKVLTGFVESYGLHLEDVLFTKDLRRRSRSQLVEEVTSLSPIGNSLREDGMIILDKLSKALDHAVITAPPLHNSEKLLKKFQEVRISTIVNSSTPSLNLNHVVNERGWGSYFQAVFGGPASKEENLTAFLRSRKFSPSNVLIVGDSDDDALCAATVGASFCLVPEVNVDLFELVSSHLEQLGCCL